MLYFYEKLESEEAEKLEEEVVNESITKDVVRKFERPFFIKEMEYQADNDTLYISFRRGGDYKYVGLVKHNGESLVRRLLRANATKEAVSTIFHEKIRINPDIEYTRVDVSKWE